MFSIKEKWNWPNCPKKDTPPPWPAQILLPNQPPKALVFIPVNTSTFILHEKPNPATCTLPAPKQKKERKKGKKLSSYQLWCQKLWL